MGFKLSWACGYGFGFRLAQVGFRKWICFGFFFFFRFVGMDLVVVDVDGGSGGGSGGGWFGFWIWNLDFVWVF